MATHVTNEELGLINSAPKTRSRKFMMACDLDHLPWAHNNVNLIRKKLYELYTKSKCKWIGMLHDDTDKKHVVISFYFKNARTVHSIAKALSIPDCLVLTFKGSLGDLFSYPIHATRGGKYLKRKYKPEQAFTNFDYVDCIRKVDEARQRNKSHVDDLIDDYVQEKITLNELLSQITVDEFLDKRFAIKHAKRDLIKKQHIDYKCSMHGRGIKVVVFYDKINWACDHDRPLYEKLKQTEGFLKPEYYCNINSLACAFAQEQGPYKYFDVDQGYAYGYKGEHIGYCDAVDILMARSNMRRNNIIKAIKLLVQNPMYYDSVVIDDRGYVPLNLKLMSIACSDGYLPDFVGDPHTWHANVVSVGTNSEYERFLRNTGITLN